MKRETTSQELLERYIHAIQLMLPPEKMEDIGAEIRANLESQMEDQARSLGRELNATEMSLLLKQHGHPVKVAYPYREPPARGLIGPALFPLYWFALRAVLVVWLMIRLIIAVFTAQGTTPVGTVLLTLGRDVLLAGLIIPAGVTLIFAVWEYLEFKYRYSERWKPESLAPVPSIHLRSSTPHPTVQIIGGIVWLIFWALALYSPAFSWAWGSRGIFGPSETLYAMRFPIWLVAFLGISQSWLGYTRFAGGKWRRMQRLAAVAAGVIVSAVLLWSGDLLIAGPKWNPAQAKSVATLNQMLGGVLMLICILAGFALLQTFIRILRRPGRRTPAADLKV